MKKSLKLLIILLLSINLYANSTLQKVTVQLDWKYQFQHAGLIVAKEKGYYKDVGLDVKLLEYQVGTNISKDVLTQKVNFGLSNTSLIYNSKGMLQPTVLLATYLQKSPLIFVTQKYITKPAQLNGKVIMITDYESINSSLSLLLEHFFIKSTNVPHAFSIKDFKNKKVDAMSAFISNELYNLDKQNIPYNIIDPSDYGFVTNAMNLFTSYTYANKNPEQIKKFIEATNKGWEYSLTHMQEVAELMHSKYRPSKSIEELSYEAKKIKELMLLDLFDIGEVNKELMVRVYKQLVKSGKLLPNQKLDKLTFKEVLANIKNDNLSFTKEEKKYLEKKGTIKLCVDPSWMPFESIHNGKHIGIIADFYNLLRKKSNIDIKLHPTQDWEHSLEAIKNRDCDILSGATPTPKRLNYMDFTSMYLKSPIVLATKVDKPFVDNIEKVKNKKLGIAQGYAIAGILRAKYNNINIVTVKNMQDGLKKVENGEIYGYIDSLTAMAYTIQNKFLGSIKVSSRLNENDTASIGTRNDEPILHSIFEKLVKSVSEAKMQGIVNKWISIKESVNINYTIAIELIGFVFLLFALISIYAYQLKKYNKKIKELSRIDTLTKIYNRVKLDEILEEQEKYVARYKTSCGIILLDIDDFKKVNDVHGHLVGDEVLKQFSLILKDNIRETDFVGRWGGEEFLVICPNTELESLKNVAEHLMIKIENAIFSKGLHVTASFGLSCIIDAKSSEKTVGEADKALYLAKDSGKNKVVTS